MPAPDKPDAFAEITIVPSVKKIVMVAWQGMAILVITFLLTEAAVRACRRFFPSAFPSYIFYDQSYNRYRGKPGAPDYDFRLNSHGFKDTEFARKKESARRRIVALGDSFAFGVVPYQYNYLTLLEDRLNANGVPAEVINMGIPGIGPPDYLALLGTEGLELQPDIVLLSFFVGNDFTETMRWRTKLHELSDVVALAKYAVDINFRATGQVFHRQAAYDDGAPSFSESTFLAIEEQRSWIYLKQTPNRQALTDAVNYLVRIRQLCERGNAALIVLVIPDEIQVNPALQIKVRERLGVGPDDVDFTLPNRFLDEQLKKSNIDWLDLLEPFSAASTGARLYKPNDSHWNIAGNKLAADVLQQHVSGRLNR